MPPAEVVAAREKLVNEARAARKRGELELGNFLLDAAALDSAELGIKLDVKQARERYDKGVADFKGAAARYWVQDAIRVAYGTLYYQSLGGNIADVLLEGGGSCEQLSHLIAATMHDGGFATSAFVRYYGGGTPHLAPILRIHRRDFDLVSGDAALPGGSQFPAADLIEVYARKHGLADGPVDTGGNAPRWSDGRSSFAGGYPPNDDGYEAIVPLFADDAFASVEPLPSPGGSTGSSGGGNGAGDNGAGDNGAGDNGEFDYKAFEDRMDKECPVYQWNRMGSESFAVLTNDGAYDVETLDMPTKWDLRNLSRRIARWEALASNKKTPAEQLVHHGCLAFAYEKLAVQFSLMRMPALMKTAQDRAIASRDAAEKVAERDWTDEEIGTLLADEAAWTISAIKDPTFVLEVALRHPTIAGMGLLAGIMDNESSRDKALAFIEKRSILDRMALLTTFPYPRNTQRWSDGLEGTDFGRARDAQARVMRRFMDGELEFGIIQAKFAEVLRAEGFPEQWADELDQLFQTLEEIQKSNPDATPQEIRELLEAALAEPPPTPTQDAALAG